MGLLFEPVYDADGKPTPLALAILFSHLERRTPEMNISHKTMPSWDQHCAFVASRPYAGWWLVYDDVGMDTGHEFTCIGQVYFTRAREIGIQIADAYHRKGCASNIIAKVIEIVPRGPVFANVSPSNIASQKLFDSLGFSVCQWTYRLDPVFFDEPLYPGHPAAASLELAAHLEPPSADSED